MSDKLQYIFYQLFPLAIKLLDKICQWLYHTKLCMHALIIKVKIKFVSPYNQIETDKILYEKNLTLTGL